MKDLVFKLEILVSIRIHLILDVSRVVRYKELVKRQKVEEPKLIKIDGVEEWKIERIINKSIEQEYIKYFVY